jgi:uncharacterized protein YeaO (DUF488 family)
MIFIKRAYEPAEKNDGPRFLVDQLWPRGVSKPSLKLTRWVRGVAPSSTLRHWFGHEAEKWDEFQKRYFAELDKKPSSWEPLLEAAQDADLTLVFAAADTEHNNAVALRSYLILQLKNKARERRAKQASAKKAAVTKVGK